MQSDDVNNEPAWNPGLPQANGWPARSFCRCGSRPIVRRAGSQVLIGQVVLEQLDLIADCKNRTLTPRHPEGPVLAIR